jgi:hypothetical protein
VPVFTPDRPLATRESVVVVENRLLPGRYRFRLVVVDDDGNESAPDERVVVVLGTT